PVAGRGRGSRGGQRPPRPPPCARPETIGDPAPGAAAVSGGARCGLARGAGRSWRNPMSPLHLRRLKLLAVIGILFYGVIFARLVSIQVFGHAKLQREARGQQTSRVILEPERGLIY